MDIAKLRRAWRRSSREDFKVAHSPYEMQHDAYCLFFCHLAVEKEIKRIYLQRRREMPPFIHNLVRIIDKCDLHLEESIRRDLQELRTFNIKARYEIIKSRFHKKATKSNTEKWLTRTAQLLDRLRKIK